MYQARGPSGRDLTLSCNPVRRSVSPSSTDSRSPRRRRRSTRSDSGLSASHSEDEGRRRKKERKSKKKEKKRDKDGKKDKLKSLVGGYQETEEELDARYVCRHRFSCN